VLGIGGSLMQAKPWMLLASALFAAAPVVTFGNYVREIAFIWKWGPRHFEQEPNAVAPEPAQ